MTTASTEAMRLVPDIISLSSSTHLDDEQRAALLAMRIEALSNPVRLRILRTLIESPENTVSVTALTELVGASSQGRVSSHIQRLVYAGFLECMEMKIRGIGMKHYYRVKKQAIHDALNGLLNYLSAAEAQALTG